jgi:hypothetical protein
MSSNKSIDTAVLWADVARLRPPVISDVRQLKKVVKRNRHAPAAPQL